MNQSIKQESTSISSPPTPQGSPYPTQQHNPYARMSQRRAIACTICAKAKTKCDKATPSCSRCTAKGLHCEPRSTRRTSDNSYRKPTKHLVSPKRYPTNNSMSPLGTSPRSVPSSGRPQIMRSVSQMDYHTAAKLGQQPANFNFNNMLSPLPTYAPHIVDDCYSYSSSPEQGMHGFPMSIEKNYMASRSGTPDSFASYEPLPMSDTFDPYMNSSAWSDDGSIPIGLGFEHDIPNMMPGDMWGTPEPEMAQPLRMCDSPTSMHGWSHPQLSMSPPQLPMGGTPHKQAVPSLSISECSEDYNSPRQSQDEWNNFQSNSGHMMGKPIVTRPFMENVKAYPTAPQPIWEDIIMPRTHTF
jgi:hypothetical protein